VVQVVPRLKIVNLCRLMICGDLFLIVDDFVDEFSIRGYHHIGVQELGIA